MKQKTFLQNEHIFHVNNHTVQQVQGSLGITYMRQVGGHILEHRFYTH